MSELRSPAVATAFETALRGDAAQLLDLLARHSRLPGPNPNTSLARALAERIVASGPAADRLVGALCAATPETAPAGSPREFWSCCAAFALAARSQAGHRGALSDLETLAEDPRLHVRTSVVEALVLFGRREPARLLDALSSWMDGYLQAAAALEILRSRPLLDGLPSSDAALARLEDARQLLEAASRADQRTHGYRTLLRTFSQTTEALLGRYPDRVVAWLEERVNEPGTDLHEALEASILSARSAMGKRGDLEARAQAVLQQNAPARRDPTTYVGPTRERAARRGRAMRKSKHIK